MMIQGSPQPITPVLFTVPFIRIRRLPPRVVAAAPAVASAVVAVPRSLPMNLFIV